MSTISTVPQCANLLLSLMPEDELQSLMPRLQPVSMQFKQVITERGKPFEHVYFPCTSVFSVIAYMENGTAVEIGAIGNEGFSGIDILMGSEVATETTICQIVGDCLRMSAADFRKTIKEETTLRHLTQRFLQAYVSQVSQSVACNRLHTIEERFARWVLLTHDRINGDGFYLTQEFLADMLGVHRPSVSLVASAFQQAGLITYSRGRLIILNRQGLEDAACECYAVVQKQYERLFGVRRHRFSGRDAASASSQAEEMALRASG